MITGLTALVAVLLVVVMILLGYATWRIYHLEDDLAEARETAEHLAEKLNKRPVRIINHVYCNGELINEKLQAILRDFRRHTSGSQEFGRAVGSDGNTNQPQGEPVSFPEHARYPQRPAIFD